MSAQALLRHRPFLALLTGRSVSLAGNGLANIAITFAVLDLTGSATDLGIVLAARSVPQVVLLLFGGVLADRLPRHLVLVVSNLVCGLTQTVAATLLLTDHASVGALVALEAVNGASAAFIFPASAGLLPQTVPAGELQPANAIFRMLSTAAMVAGMSLGGVLVAGVGPGWGLAVDALSFVVAAACFRHDPARPRRTAACCERPHRPARGLVGVPVAHLALGRRARFRRHQRRARGRLVHARPDHRRPGLRPAGLGVRARGRDRGHVRRQFPGRCRARAVRASAGTSRCSSTCRRTCSAGSTPMTRSGPWWPFRSGRSSPVRWRRQSACAGPWCSARWC